MQEICGRKSSGIGRYASAHAVLCALACHGAQAQTPTWNGGTGTWNTAANWTGGIVPDGTNYYVFIDGSNAASSVVTLNQAAALRGLTIDAGDSLGISNGYYLRMYGGVTTNNGALSLNSAESYTYLFVDGTNVTLQGAGRVTLGNGFGNEIRYHASSSTDRLVNDQVIEGRGTIDVILQNQPDGVLDANVAGGTLETVRDLSNTGLLRARNGGLLKISGSGESSGDINAATGSEVRFTNGNFTLSGTVSVTGAGSTRVSGGNFLVDGTTTLKRNFTNDGAVQMDAGTLRLDTGVIQGGAFSVTGNFQWVADTIRGPGVTNIIQPGATMTLTNGGMKYLESSALWNRGTATWSNGTNIYDVRLIVAFLDGFQNSVANTDSFTVITANAPITGTIDNLLNGRVYTEDGYGSFAVSYLNGGNDLVLNDWQFIPEPSTALLVSIAGPLFTARRRRVQQRLPVIR